MSEIRRVIPSARIKNETPTQIEISSGESARVGIIVTIGLVLLFGIFNGLTWWQPSQDIFLASGMAMTCILPAFIVAIFLPFSTQVTFSKDSNMMVCNRRYLVGIGPWPQQREEKIDVKEIFYVRHEEQLFGIFNDVNIRTENRLFTLNFGLRRSEAESVTNKIGKLLMAIDDQWALQSTENSGNDFN